ncbi:MAG: hypothetical protein CM15mV59_0320 [Caudoviricetes sp.]|nr:MAG: hypothetical protein CM15mV59_0320 [Caudoviricetes sp.]
MSLWGNNDNLTSSGTVSLNYDTGVVTVQEQHLGMLVSV